MTETTIKSGDRARLIRIPTDIIDDDLRKLFEQCVGHAFPVGDVDVCGDLIALEIGELFGRESYMESIYVERDCIEIVA